MENIKKHNFYTKILTKEQYDSWGASEEDRKDIKVFVADITDKFIVTVGNVNTDEQIEFCKNLTLEKIQNGDYDYNSEVVSDEDIYVNNIIDNKIVNEFIGEIKLFPIN